MDMEGSLSQQIYEQIKSAIMQHQNIVPLTFPVTPDIQDIRYAIRNIMRDNPDIFWFDHQYHFHETTTTIEFRYIFSAKRVEEIQQDIKDVVENDFCIDYVKTLTPREQIAYVYKWLVTYCNYNTNSAYNQSIYSVFIRKNSVCTGYAKAAQYLFGLLGIETHLVFGRINWDRKDGRHCWNIVKSDDRYHHFDSSLGGNTFDDIVAQAGIDGLLKIEGVNYAFLCKSTEDILKTRSIEEIESLPQCQESWPSEFICKISDIKIKQRSGIRGARLSYAGSTANVYLCAKDNNTVIKEFHSDCIDTATNELRYMQLLKDCRYTLQYNEQYTDIQNGFIAIEQSTPILDLLCSYYYELSMKELTKLAIDIANAWLECRKRGVIYRDIHICNIYRSNDGTYKLGDFGSCTLKEERKVIGNQWFMAPETFTSGIFTEQSAIYSVGMVLYFILNNLRPAFWTPENADEALRRRISGIKLPLPAALRDVSVPNLLDILEMATAALPTQRYRNFVDMLNALHSFNGNWTVIHKGSSLDVDLNAGNYERLNEAYKYIPREMFHAYAIGSHCIVSTELCQHERNRCFNKDAYDDKFKKDYMPDINLSTMHVDKIEDYASTAVDSIENDFAASYSWKDAVRKPDITFEPKIEASLLERLFSKKRKKVYSSVFAPAEVMKGRHMLTQFYFHLQKEEEYVKEQAVAADKNAERRSYMPLSLKLKKGDVITVDFNIYGKKLLMSERTKVASQGECTKCYFEYLIPDNVETYELSCIAYISANNAMVGEVRFHTNIVDTPRKIHTDIISHRYNRIFISYSHSDTQQAKSLALAYKMQGVEYFYDRDYLRCGDLWEEKVFEYIDSADLFILCWSTNAEKSKNVAKERARALIRAYPNKDINEATLKICPISLKPVAKLPSDMEQYAYEEL